MRHAVLLAVASHAKIEVWIAQFGRAAHGAFVERLGFASRTARVALSSLRDFAAVPSIVNNFWTEKDQIIGHGSYQRHAIRHWPNDKFAEEDGRRRPCDPLDFRRQDKKQVNHLIGIEPGESKEQRSEQH